MVQSAVVRGIRCERSRNGRDNPTLMKKMHTGENNEFDLVCSRLSGRVAFWLFFLDRVGSVLTR